MAHKESHSGVQAAPIGDSGPSVGTRQPLVASVHPPVASEQPCSSTSRAKEAAPNQDGTYSTPALQVASPNAQPTTHTGVTSHTPDRSGARSSRGRKAGFSLEEIRLLEMCLSETKALTVADYESMVAPLYNEHVQSLVITRGTGRRQREVQGAPKRSAKSLRDKWYSLLKGKPTGTGSERSPQQRRWAQIQQSIIRDREAGQNRPSHTQIQRAARDHYGAAILCDNPVEEHDRHQLAPLELLTVGDVQLAENEEQIHFNQAGVSTPATEAIAVTAATNLLAGVSSQNTPVTSEGRRIEDIQDTLAAAAEKYRPIRGTPGGARGRKRNRSADTSSQNDDAMFGLLEDCMKMMRESMNKQAELALLVIKQGQGEPTRKKRRTSRRGRKESPRRTETKRRKRKNCQRP